MIFVLVYQNEKYWLKPEYHQSAHTNFAINISWLCWFQNWYIMFSVF